MSPEFDDLVDAETSGAERERLRGVHEMLVRAGPPAELPPQLRKAPTFGAARLQQRRAVKRRAMLLLAAALSVLVVFAAGYAVADHQSNTTAAPPRTLALVGTAAAPHARATLDVWHSRNGNWPMRLSVAGLPKLPQNTYYEVYLVRDGQPWGSCGTFRIASGAPGVVTLTLNAPYSLQKSDSWIVTRVHRGAAEPGTTVLKAVSA